MAGSITPNLVILGPPKCGTSSLFNWLTTHPQVCGSHRKETFYLMDRDNPLRVRPGFHDAGWDGYSRHFPEDAGHFAVRVEATTHYLYQETALEALSSLEDVHVCVVLRDPALRVWSSFNYTQNNLSRVPFDVGFDRYLDRVLEGQDLPSEYCPDEKSRYVLERDVEYGEYARHLQPWIDRLGREQVHWVRFEDMQRRPREMLKRLVAPFDVDAAWFDRCELPVRNETYRVMHQGLHRVARRMSRVLPGSTVVKPALKRAYLRLQSGRSRSGTRPPEKEIERLRVHYEPYNLQLEQLLSIDLSIWRPARR